MGSRRRCSVERVSGFEPLEARLLLNGASLLESPPPELLIQPDVEAEWLGGASNDDPAAAQALQFEYLLSSPEGPCGPQQAAVLGQADGTGGAGQPYSQSAAVYGYISAPTVYRAAMYDAIAPGGGGLLTISAKANLAGAERFLSVWAEGIHLADVFVHDGLDLVPVSAQVSLSREQLALLAADGVVELAIAPSAAVARTGAGYIAMQLDYSGPGGAGAADWYSFTLAAGDSADITLTAAPGATELSLSLHDASGALLVASSMADGSAPAVTSLPAGAGGTFSVRIAGSGEYLLSVTRNATTDREPNDTPAAAQALSGATVDARRWAVGTTGGTDADFYALPASSGELLKLELHAPAGSGLVPRLRLYDPAGRLVATGAGALHYRAEANGTYAVEVSGADGSSGGYVLGVKTQPRPEQAGGSSEKDKPAKEDKTAPGQAVKTAAEPVKPVQVAQAALTQTTQPAPSAEVSVGSMIRAALRRHVAQWDAPWGGPVLLPQL